MPDPGMPKSLYNALGAFQGVRIGGSVPVTESPDTRATTDPNMPKSLYPPNSALGAFQGAAPALGTPLNWALAPSGISLEYVLRHKIMSAQQQLGIPQGFNPGHAGMSQMSTLPFLASMPGATDLMQNRGMASSSFAEDSQSGIWRQASGYEQQVSVMSRSKGGVDRRVLLTRALLANYFHESLDTVAEKMLVSKTTIKAACRRLGLVKWPYRHSGPRKMRPPPSPQLLKKEEESGDDKEKEGGDKHIGESGDDKRLNESMGEDDKHAHESESESDKGSNGHRTPMPLGSSFGKDKHKYDSDSENDTGEGKNSGGGGAHVSKHAHHAESKRETDKDDSESDTGEGRNSGAGGAFFGDKHAHGPHSGGRGDFVSSLVDRKVIFHSLLDPVSNSRSDSSEHEEEAQEERFSPSKRRKVGGGSSLVTTKTLVEMKRQSQQWCQAVGRAHAAREAEAATRDTAIPVRLAGLPHFLREADWSFLHHQTKGTPYFAEGLVLSRTTRTSSPPVFPEGISSRGGPASRLDGTNPGSGDKPHVGAA
mmetsp:Transcript_37728/g.89304  ORF Transcript_37728/g.89304 Transcript_37728/m.89304 type:complete len:537 (-) Transcript_37728:189-1799(-)